MSERTSLPSRRRSESAEFDWNNVEFRAQISRGPDGRPLEIFLDGGKTGSAVNVAAREAAVVTSLALQFGVPLETLTHALEKLENGKPAGPVGTALSLFEAPADAS